MVVVTATLLVTLVVLLVLSVLLLLVATRRGTLTVPVESSISPGDAQGIVDPCNILVGVFSIDGMRSHMAELALATLSAAAIDCDVVNAWRWMDSHWARGDEHACCNADEASGGIAACGST